MCQSRIYQSGLCTCNSSLTGLLDRVFETVNPSPTTPCLGRLGYHLVPYRDCISLPPDNICPSHLISSRLVFFDCTPSLILRQLERSASVIVASIAHLETNPTLPCCPLSITRLRPPPRPAQHKQVDHHVCVVSCDCVPLSHAVSASRLLASLSLPYTIGC